MKCDAGNKLESLGNHCCCNLAFSHLDCYLVQSFPSFRITPLRVVTWEEIGEVIGYTDFDGDGNDELIVQDKQNQWWAIWWDEGKC